MLHLKLTIMALLWAGGFIAGKNIADQAGPFTISFLRFFVATVVLVVLVYKKEQFQKIRANQLMCIACAAFFGEFCYNYLFFSGIKLVDAGRGSVIISTVPVVVLIVSCLLLQERLNKFKLLGIVFSVIGAWVVVSNSNLEVILGAPIGRGELYLIACVFCAVIFTLLSKCLLVSLSSLMAMTAISAFGTVFLFVPAVIEMNLIPAAINSYSFLLNLLYLSVGPSVIAVTIYYDAIKKVGPTRASQYMNLIPVFAVVLAFVFLGEQLSASLIVGGGFVTTGLWLANLTT